MVNLFYAIGMCSTFKDNYFCYYTTKGHHLHIIGFTDKKNPKSGNQSVFSHTVSLGLKALMAWPGV